MLELPHPLISSLFLVLALVLVLALALILVLALILAVVGGDDTWTLCAGLRGENAPQ